MLLPLVASLFLAQAPSADLQPSAWDGRWEIDKGASDDPMPLVRKLKVPFTQLRKLAARQVQVISVGSAGLQVAAADPDGDKPQVFPLDGKTVTRGEFLGSPFEVVSRVEAGAVVLSGVIFIDQARTAFESRRTLEGDTMRVDLTIGEVRSKRVFRRMK
jgi:hypothetical protein